VAILVVFFACVYKMAGAGWTRQTVRHDVSDGLNSETGLWMLLDESIAKAEGRFLGFGHSVLGERFGDSGDALRYCRSIDVAFVENLFVSTLL